MVQTVDQEVVVETHHPVGQQHKVQAAVQQGMEIMVDQHQVIIMLDVVEVEQVPQVALLQEVQQLVLLVMAALALLMR